MRTFFKTLGIVSFLLFLVCKTSFAYSIDGATIQYRTFENGNNDLCCSYLNISKNGSPIEEGELGSITLTDSDQNEIGISLMKFWLFDIYFYNCSSDTCNEYGPSPFSGVYIVPEEELAAGSYQFDIETADGQAHRVEQYYPGKLELPFVHSSSMSSRYENGELVLGWRNPDSQENWFAVNELVITLYYETENDMIYVTVPSSVNSIRVPGTVLDNAKAAFGSELSRWAIQTRAFDSNGTNYARGYSGEKDLALSDDTGEADGDDGDGSGGCFINAIKSVQ